MWTTERVVVPIFASGGLHHGCSDNLGMGGAHPTTCVWPTEDTGDLQRSIDIAVESQGLQIIFFRKPRVLTTSMLVYRRVHVKIISIANDVLWTIIVPWLHHSEAHMEREPRQSVVIIIGHVSSNSYKPRVHRSSTYRYLPIASDLPINTDHLDS